MLFLSRCCVCYIPDFSAFGARVFTHALFRAIKENTRQKAGRRLPASLVDLVL